MVTVRTAVNGTSRLDRQRGFGIVVRACVTAWLADRLLTVVARAFVTFDPLRQLIRGACSLLVLELSLAGTSEGGVSSYFERVTSALVLPPRAFGTEFTRPTGTIADGKLRNLAGICRFGVAFGSNFLQMSIAGSIDFAATLNDQ